MLERKKLKSRSHVVLEFFSEIQKNLRSLKNNDIYVLIVKISEYK